MWNWDQGHLGYFQYDVLRTVARFVTENQWKRSDSTVIRKATGLSFSAPATHSPWRQYARVFKLCLLVSEKNGVSVSTPIARLLTTAGAVTCDEYLHYLVEATSDPSPALQGWKEVSKGASVRHPLCFSLKYLLAKVAGLNEPVASFAEVVGAYISSGFSGAEDDTAFLGLMSKRASYAAIGTGNNGRQARESIKFISQISYLHSADGKNIITSLSQNDAREIFQSLNPVQGPYEQDGDDEIQRLAALFKDGSEHDFFNYDETSIPDVEESGFTEGNKVRKTHIVIERNPNLRKLYFQRRPTAQCDACDLDTKKRFPWVNHVLDLHHILPLSSGTRVDSKSGTILDDLVPICPTCHRAVHRYYDQHLAKEGRKDFLTLIEAKDTYADAKSSIVLEA